MARTRRLHRSGSSGLRSPILKRHPNLKSPSACGWSRHDSLRRFLHGMRAKTEVDMFFKSKAPEKDKNATANTAEVMGRTVQPHDQTWARSELTKAGTASCIGSDMSIVGKIECEGPAQVFGRIE